jgi:hypothetical protein
VVRAVQDGGIVASAIAPVTGAEATVRYLLGPRENVPGLAFELTTVNGRVGLISRDTARRPLAAMGMEGGGGRIGCIWAIRKPNRLTRWSQTWLARKDGQRVWGGRTMPEVHADPVLSSRNRETNADEAP